ncbi:oxamate carbamoyltransferase subunit AllG family protein [Escherichia coli]
MQPASSLISELNRGQNTASRRAANALAEMTGPMKGACVGACLFEGWAKDEAQALAMLERGSKLIPCHHVNAVGRMAALLLPYADAGGRERDRRQPGVLQPQRRRIGKVMRFGAYGEDVLTRHRWMRDVLMPVLSAALGAWSTVSISRR